MIGILFMRTFCLCEAVGLLPTTCLKCFTQTARGHWINYDEQSKIYCYWANIESATINIQLHVVTWPAVGHQRKKGKNVFSLDQHSTNSEKCILDAILLCQGIHGKMLPENAVEKPVSLSDFAVEKPASPIPSYYTCPRMVTIRYREYSDSGPYRQILRLCHGTMVDRYWVATTAKCVSVNQNSGIGNIDYWQVFFTNYDKVFDVENIYIPHGEYLRDTENQSYQIAFLKLREAGIYFMPGEAGNCSGLEDQRSEDKRAGGNDAPYSNKAKGLTHDDVYGMNYKDSWGAGMTESMYPGYKATHSFNAKHNEMPQDYSYGKNYIDGSNPSMTEKIYPGCPLDNNGMGWTTWSFLHSIAAHFPENPTEAQQQGMKQFMNIFAMIFPFPCDECASLFRNSLKKNPPVTTSQENFSQWLCNVHNEVKIRDSHGENPPFDCKQVNERWRDGWKDGTCTKNQINKFRD